MLPKNPFGVPHCTGKSKHTERGSVWLPGYYSESWLNSCETAKLLWLYGSTATLLGGVALIPGMWSVGVYAIFLGLGVAYVAYRRDLSQVMAVVIWRGFVRFGCWSQQ
jgi:hypothetical protein